MNKNIKVFSGLVGAFVGLGFYIAFSLLGYSILFCWLAATVVAVSAGWILFGWKSEEPVKQSRPKKARLTSKFRFAKRPRVVEAQKRLVELRTKRFPRRKEEGNQKARA